MSSHLKWGTGKDYTISDLHVWWWENCKSCGSEMGINTQIPEVLDHVTDVCEPDIIVIINTEKPLEMNYSSFWYLLNNKDKVQY